jgi:hypothetical protein
MVMRYGACARKVPDPVLDYVLGQQSMRQRKDGFGIESQQSDRTVTAAVSIEAI